MKLYIQTIQWLQSALLGLGIIILIVLPLIILFNPDFTSAQSTMLYDISHGAVFFVMLIRPLADILRKMKPLRALVILRKGFGVLSASIVVSFMIASVAMDPTGYVTHFVSPSYWSFTNYASFGHVADVAAVLLLITSNNFSKRILGAWWKRVQRLSYVYFYASTFFVFATYGTMTVLYYMIIITLVTTIAFMLNTMRSDEIKLRTV